MSEFSEDRVTIDQEAENLVAKEQWIQDTAELIVDTRVTKVGRLNPDLAIDGVRLSSIWRDLFEKIREESPVTSTEDVKEKLAKAFEEASSLLETEHRYPNGMLSIQLTIAAHDALCLGFGREAEEVGFILDWDMQAYFHSATTT